LTVKATSANRWWKLLLPTLPGGSWGSDSSWPVWASKRRSSSRPSTLAWATMRRPSSLSEAPVMSQGNLGAQALDVAALEVQRHQFHELTGPVAEEVQPAAVGLEASHEVGRLQRLPGRRQHLAAFAAGQVDQPDQRLVGRAVVAQREESVVIRDDSVGPATAGQHGQRSRVGGGQRIDQRQRGVDAGACAALRGTVQRHRAVDQP
jgi:hypothetical protein